MVKQRIIFFTGFAVCTGLILAALYFEHVMGLAPCPLCIFQRVAVIVLGVVLLIAGLHNPGRTGRVVYAVLAFLAASLGAAIAGRHVWLQNLPPDQVPDCGPGLDYLMDVFPLSEAIRFVLKGSGECAAQSWAFLGLSMPAWMLLIFIVFASASVAVMFFNKVISK